MHSCCDDERHIGGCAHAEPEDVSARPAQVKRMSDNDLLLGLSVDLPSNSQFEAARHLLVGD